MPDAPASLRDYSGRFHLFGLQQKALLIICFVGILSLFTGSQALKAGTEVRMATVTTVSAASYSPEAIAPESIVAAFGSGLATATAVAVGDADPNTPGIQLPTELAGVSVEVNNRKAGLFFVSPGQINYLIPAATEPGTASVTVKAGSAVIATGTVQIRQTGPAIFTANSDGKGVPAAYALRVKADGTQSTEAIAKYDATTGGFLTQPLSLGLAGERVFLVLFLSGIRYAADLNRDGNLSESVRVILGGSEIIPAYAGRQGSLLGLDQLNVELPRALLGQGFADLRVRVTGAGESNATDLELLVPAGAGPTANDVSTATDEDVAKAVTLGGSDPQGKALSWRIVNAPVHGTLSGTAPNLTYTPAKNYNGGDSFRFVVSNGAQTSNAANAFIAIRSVNDPPVLTVPGAQSVSIGKELSFEISATDPDQDQSLQFADPDPLPAGATWSRISNTVFRFTWTPGFALTGNYTLRFRVTDSDSAPLSETKSVNVAVVFQTLNGQKWGNTTGPQGGNVSFLIADGENLYAGMNGGGIYFSGDRGLSWREITEVNARLSDVYLKTVAVGGGNLFVSHFASSAFPNVFRSGNGGLNWTEARSDLGEPGKPLVYILATSGNALLAGTDKGIWRSTNGGDNWSQVSSGIPGSLEVFTLAVSGSLVFAGTRNGIYRSTDQGQTWALSGLNGSVVSSLTVSDSNVFAESGGKVHRADLSGAGWTEFQTGLPASSPVTDLTSLGATTFAGTGSGVYRLTAGASVWSPASTGIINRAITTLAVSGTTLLAGTDGGGVYRSNNNGELWTSASSGLAGAVTLALVTSGNNLFAATNGAGVQRSTNNGQSWTPVNAGLPSLSVTSLAATTEYLFAGINGGGVFRSRDAGESWTVANADLPGLNVTALEADGETLFVTAGGGVFRSTNFGASWVRVNNLSSFRALARSGAHLFAGGGTVFRSADNGLNWTSSGSGIGGSVTSLAAAGSVLIAGTDNSSLLGNTYRSIDQGQSWQPLLTNVDDVPVAAQLASGELLFMSLDGAGIRYLEPGGNRWNFLNDNIKRVYDAISVRSYLQTTRMCASGASLFAGTRGSGVLRLTLNSVNWAKSSNGLPVTQQVRSIVVHTPVNHLLPSGSSLYAATRGTGVYRSDNQGASWTASNTGLPGGTNVFTLAESAGSIFAGTIGNGVFRLNSQGRWSEVNTGLNSRRINALLSTATELFAATDGGGVFRFTAQIQSWQSASSLLPDLFVSSLAVAGTRLYAGTYSSGVFVSENNGARWAPLNQGLTAFDVRTLTVLGNDLFAGTLSGGIFRRSLSGSGWTPVNRDLPQNLPTYCLFTAGSTLYAGTVYGVFSSSDQGQTWTQINAGLGNQNAYWLALSSGSLFVGTEDGVYTTQLQSQ